METTNRTFRITLIWAVFLIYIWAVIPGVIGTLLVEKGIILQHWQSVVQGIIFSGFVIPTLILIRKLVKNAEGIDFGIGNLKEVAIQFLKGGGLIFIPFLLTIVITSILGINEYQVNPDPLVLQGLLIGFIGVILHEALPEELLIRGYLFGILRTRMGKWASSIITVLAFVLWPIIAVTLQTHVFNLDIAIGATGSVTGGYIINMLLFGAFAIFLRNISGSIWMGVGFHCFFVYMNYFLGQTEYSLFQVMETGSELPGQITLLSSFLLTFATVVFISYWKKRRNVKRTAINSPSY